MMLNSKKENTFKYPQIFPSFEQGLTQHANKLSVQ